MLTLANTLGSGRAILMVMHYQEDIFSLAVPSAVTAKLTQNCIRLIADARSIGVKVVFIDFALGHDEIPPANRLLESLLGTGLLKSSNPIPAIVRNADDKVYTSARVSAFSGSELDRDLRSDGIDTVILAGVATSGVVASTVYTASDLDYRIVVDESSCFDPDHDVHSAIFKSVIVPRAYVLPSQGIYQI